MFFDSKATKVAVLYFYVSGFRGDWKALNQTFAFNPATTGMRRVVSEINNNLGFQAFFSRYHNYQ